MKYIDAEKLIAEIERKIDTCYRTDGRIAPPRQRNAIAISEFRDLLSHINSLRQEQQKVDLEAEVDKYLVENYTNDTDVKTPFLERMFSHDRNDLVQFARHFAEWGAIHLNARKEE